MKFGFGFSCSVRVLLAYYFCAVSDWSFGVSPEPMAGRQVASTGGRVCVYEISWDWCANVIKSAFFYQEDRGWFGSSGNYLIAIKKTHGNVTHVRGTRSEISIE